MAADPSQSLEPLPAWTVGRLLDWTTRWFQENRVEGGRLSAELLLAHALACEKIHLYTRYSQEPTAAERARFRELVKLAGRHTPIAYLLGKREFFSLSFEVTPAVLIPRPETEALVQRTVDICRTDKQRIWQLLDLGTGSGCVAIAVATYAANTQIVASDISPEAIALASRNVEAHQLTARVTLTVADGVNLSPEQIPEGGFDILMTNPPYVSNEDWQNLPPHIRDHEPHSALTLGDDGLGMYRRLACEAASILKPQGRLLTEVGAGQIPAVRTLFETAGWQFRGVYRDACDPHDRVAEFQQP